MLYTEAKLYSYYVSHMIFTVKHIYTWNFFDLGDSPGQINLYQTSTRKMLSQYGTTEKCLNSLYTVCTFKNTTCEWIYSSGNMAKNMCLLEVT